MASKVDCYIVLREGRSNKKAEHTAEYQAKS